WRRAAERRMSSWRSIIASRSHAKDAEARFFGRHPGAESERLAEPAARLGRLDDAVVPQPRRGIAGVALARVLLGDRLLEARLVLRGPRPPLLLQRIAPHLREHVRGLAAAHDRDARVGPRPQETRTERT